jgi:cytochrome c553
MRTLVLGFLLASGFIGPAYAGDPVLGKNKAESCLACHGDHGTPAIQGVPKIDRISAEALVATMQKMREVHHDQPISAHNLSDEDLNDIAAYFSYKGD